MNCQSGVEKTLLTLASLLQISFIICLIMTLIKNETCDNVEILDAQSGTEKFNVSISEGPKTSTAQNVQFVNQNAGYVYTVNSEYDPTRASTDSSDATLQNFFSRPLKVADYQWSTSLPDFYETFNPWTEYWEHPTVSQRIANFNLLRAKLHVQFIVNGNRAHFGSLIASYLPMHNYDDFSKTRKFFRQDNIQASQRPHLYLNPTLSQGGVMKLPFFWHKNTLNVPNQEWRDMGEMTISTLQDLKHANGADDTVSITVMVWAEDVKMSTLTSAQPGALESQCGEELLDAQSADEYAKDGAVSAPASTVARIAGMLTSAPVIGPFAKATELAASSIAGVARIFGYSRPVVIADTMPIKPVFMGNLANSNIADTACKLSLDAKQELTIDPRVTGLSGTDELDIKALASRESYLTQFPWTLEAENEAALFSTEVSPVVWDTLSVDGSPTELHMPACCFAAVPFAHWRGSMKYRFQIVASEVHTGRMKLVWEPFGAPDSGYNTNYTTIVDITEKKDFTIELGWGNELSHLSHRVPGSTNKIFKNSATTTVPTGLANGILTAYVFNGLTVLNSTVNNDIKVNVFVSAGNDFEVANPYSRVIDHLTWFRPNGALAVQRDPQRSELPHLINENDPPILDSQSAEESMFHGDCDDAAIPMQETSIGTMGETQDDSDKMIHVHFGEAIPSFRSCLKRYTFHACATIIGTGPLWYSRIQNNMPYHRGRAPGAIHNNGTHNYAKMTMLNYLLPAYTGYRGATRWKYHYIGGDRNSNNYMSVCRHAFTNNGNGYSEKTRRMGTPDNTDQMAYETQLNIKDTWAGATATATAVNPCLEVEMPYYSNTRFGFAKEANLTKSGYNDYFHELEMSVNPNGNGDFDRPSPSRIMAYNSVGEDFNLFFFTGCPIAYREDTIPAP